MKWLSLVMLIGFCSSAGAEWHAIALYKPFDFNDVGGSGAGLEWRTDKTWYVSGWIVNMRDEKQREIILQGYIRGGKHWTFHKIGICKPWFRFGGMMTNRQTISNSSHFRFDTGAGCETGRFTFGLFHASTSKIYSGANRGETNLGIMARF